jgi:hypothetical protein
MSTCQNPQSPNAPFVNNPESLIRGANTAKRQAAAAALRAALKASVQQGRLKNKRPIQADSLANGVSSLKPRTFPTMTGAFNTGDNA